MHITIEIYLAEDMTEEATYWFKSLSGTQVKVNYFSFIGNDHFMIEQHKDKKMNGYGLALDDMSNKSKELTEDVIKKWKELCFKKNIYTLEEASLNIPKFIEEYGNKNVTFTKDNKDV